MQLVTAAQMVADERAAMAAGLSAETMMRRAGAAVAREIGLRWTPGSAFILAGPGNNGSDGLVCAAALADAGWRVSCALWRRDADRWLAALDPCGVPVLHCTADPSGELDATTEAHLRRRLADATLVVDALLGTGLRRPLTGVPAGLLDLVRDMRTPSSRQRPALVAVDMPTGLFADDGRLDPHTLAADLTVTFGSPKRGQVLAPGLFALGVLVVDPIGIPEAAGIPPPGLDADGAEDGSRADGSREDRARVVGSREDGPGRRRGRRSPPSAHGLRPPLDEWRDPHALPHPRDPNKPHASKASHPPRAHILTLRNTAAHLPSRPLDGHKGTFGTVLVVAGSLAYPGAALLSARAAGRAGAGLVTVASTRAVRSAIAGVAPELTWRVLGEHRGDDGDREAGAENEIDNGSADASAAPVLAAALEAVDVVLFGCGLTLGRGPRSLLDVVLAADAAADRPAPLRTVIDADGLRLLARLPEGPRALRPGAVLTPHPGEMSALTGLDVASIQADRIGVALRAAREWGQVVVLKGVPTVVADPSGRVAILPIATTALASAGTGDVLAGLVAGLLAQGARPFDAACAAVAVHGLAGLRAARTLGDRATLAPDVLDAVGPVLVDLADCVADPQGTAWSDLALGGPVAGLMALGDVADPRSMNRAGREGHP